jgi:hypothetical protein
MHTAHLQSEAKKIVYIDSLKIEVQIIEEKGHEGKEAIPHIECFLHVPTLNVFACSMFNTSRLWLLSRGLF